MIELKEIQKKHSFSISVVVEEQVMSTTASTGRKNTTGTAVFATFLALLNNEG